MVAGVAVETAAEAVVEATATPTAVGAAADDVVLTVANVAVAVQKQDTTTIRVINILFFRKVDLCKLPMDFSLYRH